MEFGGQTGRTQHAELHQLLVLAGSIEGLTCVGPRVRWLYPGQLQHVGAWWGNRPLTPASRPQAHSPPAFPDSPSGPRLEEVTLTSHLASGRAPSLSLPTRKEEDVFSQGEGLAVPGPRDLRARVSMDVAG